MAWIFGITSHHSNCDSNQEGIGSPPVVEREVHQRWPPLREERYLGQQLLHRPMFPTPSYWSFFILMREIMTTKLRHHEVGRS